MRPSASLLQLFSHVSKSPIIPMKSPLSRTIIPQFSTSASASSSAPEKQRPRVGIASVMIRSDWKEKNDRRFIIIKRGKAPKKGQWSLPGGSLEFGEDLRDGAARECQEETNVMPHWVSDSFIAVDGVARKDSPNGAIDFHFVICECIAVVEASEADKAVACDDAADLKWVTAEELEAFTEPFTDKVPAVVRLAFEHLEKEVFSWPPSEGRWKRFRRYQS